MRRAATAFAITLAVSGTASAEVPGSPPSNRGAFALDAMVAPTTGFGFGYYVTRRAEPAAVAGPRLRRLRLLRQPRRPAPLRVRRGLDGRALPLGLGALLAQHRPPRSRSRAPAARAGRSSSRATAPSSARARACASSSRGASRSSARAACSTRPIRSARSSRAGARSTWATARAASSCSASPTSCIRGRRYVAAHPPLAASFRAPSRSAAGRPPSGQARSASRAAAMSVVSK